MRFLAVFIGLAFPLITRAQVSSLPSVIDGVGGQGGLLTEIAQLNRQSLNCIGGAGQGACELARLLLFGVEEMRVIVGGVAFIVLVIAGFRLLIRQSDDELSKARRAIAGATTGLFLVFIAEPFIDAVYGGFSQVAGETLSSDASIQSSAAIFNIELLGILRWIEVLVAICAIGFLVVQSAVVMGSFGAEETIRKAYKAVLYTVLGLLLVVFDRAIAKLFGYDRLDSLPGSPDGKVFLTEVFGLLRFALLFIGVMMVAVIVYAGLTMILHLGNDEWLNKGKNAIINALLGLLLIVVSFVIVSSVILRLG